MKVYNNIEYIQINLSANQDRYYLPENSSIFNKKIDEISFYAPTEYGVISPVDGAELITVDVLSKFFFNVTKADRNELHNNVSCYLTQLTRNLRLPVNNIITPNLSSLNFVGTEEEKELLDGKCLVLYVTYETVNEDITLSSNQVTINLQSDKPVTKITDLIDYYLLSQLKTCKAIEVLSAANSGRFYLDFRTYENRSFRYIPSERIEAIVANREDYKVNKLLINDFNFDFDNCFVIKAEAEKNINAKIIFYY